MSILKAITPARAGKVTRWTWREFVKVIWKNALFSYNNYDEQMICLDFFTNSISDVDECSSVNDCQQECKNTFGSYTCGCYGGFELSSDQKSCNGWIFMPTIENLHY